MEIFYSGENIDELSELFSEEFSFKGPLYEFNSGESYIESLQADPPKDCDYSILKSYENHSSACLIYKFSKPDVSVQMAQLFEVENGKICKIILIFDRMAFL